ncbi:MAG: hypothetical protein ABIG30_03450 [Candidatus Aenigmatarchaeota archaeon]
MLIAGCETKPVITSSGGVVIKDFSVEPTRIDENDQVSFRLDVENVGTTTATCLRADLLGIDGWRGSGTTLSFNMEGFYGEWDISEGEFRIFKNFKLDFCKIPWLNEVPGVCNLAPITVNLDCDTARQRGEKCDIDIIWGDYVDKIACNENTLHPFLSKWGTDSLSPVIRASDGRGAQSGGFKSAEWVVRPPVDLPEGTRVPYDITTRITYIYKTTGVINIPALSEDEYDRRYTRGVTISDPVLEDHSDSPVILSMTRGNSPIIVKVPDWRDGGSSVQHETYRFIVRNVGDGFPITGNENGLMVGQLKLAGTGVEFEDCLGVSGGRDILIDGSKADMIKLNMQSGSREFECGIRVNVPAWDAIPIGTVSLTYDLRYEYYTTKKLRVTIEGR